MLITLIIFLGDKRLAVRGNARRKVAIETEIIRVYIMFV